MTTFQWIGGTLGRWTLAADWASSGADIPGSPSFADDVAIISQSIGTAYIVTENFSGTIADLTVGSSDATLRFARGVNLEVGGLVTNDGDILVRSDDILGFGTLLNNGSVEVRAGDLTGAGGSIVDNGIIEGAGTITGSLSGGGVVDASANGTLELVGPVTSAEVAFQIENSGVLDISGSVDSAANFDFKSATGGVLDINPQFNGTVSGMNVGTSPTQPTTVIDVQATIDTANLTGRSLFLSGDHDLTINLGNSFPTGTNVILSPDTARGGTDISFSSAPCYVAGTRILTATGQKAVEDLREGDWVVVLKEQGRSTEKIKWIGQRRVELAGHPRPELATPVLIRRDAMDTGQPNRDLFVSPDHCLFVEGRLIPALMLVNDMTIVQETSHAAVHYFHVELDHHHILLAEGLPAESYLDTGNRAMFANAGVAMLLHPEFCVNRSLRTWRDDACAPLAVDAATLRPIWGRLTGRAERMGYVPRRMSLGTEPDLQAVVAGKIIAPIECHVGHYAFILPAGTDRVLLVSRATRPADILRYRDDRRRLGVAVGSITLRAGGEMIVFPADHIPAGTGWYASEGQWRWTDGAGEVRLAPSARATVMEITLSGSACYNLEEIIPNFSECPNLMARPSVAAHPSVGVTRPAQASRPAQRRPSVAA